ncbi:MAG TPA: type II toxin-antitoxin system PemK/MazF family toxin [Lacipirellulaceae bacterium]|nr:type II toxin-antitoxin system PemK/MazF family toxin [Lacipirellulaceae bacterium]
MGKPVAGDVVVLPFPQTNLQLGKRRPALVVADLRGDDLILCQITSQAHHDAYSVILDSGDFASGQLHLRSYIRPNRLFTVEQSAILYTAARVTDAKLGETRLKLRELFS